MINEKKLIEDIRHMVGNTHIVSARSNGKTIFADFLKKFIENIIKIIEEQPKISLENKTSDWIPVEEALPEPYVDVIVTYIYNEKKYVRTTFYCNDGKWCTDIQKDFDVIAWQPLPKPYEVQDET